MIILIFLAFDFFISEIIAAKLLMLGAGGGISSHGPLGPSTALKIIQLANGLP